MITDHREAREALANNDARTYIDNHRGVIRTWPTNTNVKDLYVAVVTEQDAASQS